MDESQSDGYLLIENPEHPVWGDDRVNDLPDNWFRQTKAGPRLKTDYRPFVPRKIFVSDEGAVTESMGDGLHESWYLQAPFLTCLCCGAVYDKRTREFRKLSRLSSESRSTATTLLSLSNVTQMQKDETLPKEAQKIMSFTDNRQDASLQAGHFNDFIQIGLLRSAIFKSLPEDGYVDHSNMAIEVVKSLQLSPESYAQNPGQAESQPKILREALTDYVEYRIYSDLRRGWRVIQPNLEQCGLLTIEYSGLSEICANEEFWKDDTILSGSSPEERCNVTTAFLDHLRQSLALNALCLEGIRHESLKRKVNNTLKEPWNFDDDERLYESKWFAFGSVGRNELSLSGTSLLGKYLRSKRAWPDISESLSPSDYEPFINSFTDILYNTGFLDKESFENGFRIQLRIDILQWQKGTGDAPLPNPVLSNWMQSYQKNELSREANRYFVQFYQQETSSLQHLNSGEHTGQTSQDNREMREQKFRDGELSVLFCSPTMELGIDIADLNSVNMRNVPRTPANYAQRSGRAGRSGQPAFITSYCSAGSGHDQYFFHRREKMVAGVVVPPRLDIGNEDLVISHLHSVWLAKVGLSLRNSIADIIDLGQTDYSLSENVKQHIQLSEQRVKECIQECRNILDQCSDDIQLVSWYSDEWLEAIIRSGGRRFYEAFDRWRDLYRIAHQQLVKSQDIVRHAHQNRLTQDERQSAERKGWEAQRQLDLLCNNVKSKEDSDFYPYRYLACEGFLPGYNFPRLPIRAYIPGKRGKGNFISRGRFLALSEFGPRNIIYNEGRKYRVIRSLIPAGDSESRFTQVKLCNTCGAFHTGESLQVDLCEQCDTQLDANNSEFLANLFEMTTVLTQRAERITCDEEERTRQGYEISTQFRFSKEDGKDRKYNAVVRNTEGNEVLMLSYGPAAEIWRINRRWRRSTTIGYTFDLSLGIWNRRPNSTTDTALDVGEDNVATGVQVFVRDTKNILLLQPINQEDINEVQLINLQYAVQKGICSVLQIDDKEISSELIGTGDQQSILLWEDAEGSVGVLQRLVEEPDLMNEIITNSIEICHYDIKTSEEIDNIECARACYECLLTYQNQRDHNSLNRQLIRDILFDLIDCRTEKCSGMTFDEQYQWLRQQTDSRSRLEKDFLDQLYRAGRYLPDFAQKRLPNYPSRPDFYYETGYVCVFCDGSVHDEANQEKEDLRIRTDLRNKGYRVIVIRYDNPLNEQIEENNDIFKAIR
ncbi:helicase-related protein [candidate division KSB1 bacterium]